MKPACISAESSFFNCLRDFSLFLLLLVLHDSPYCPGSRYYFSHLRILRRRVAIVTCRLKQLWRQHYYPGDDNV
jgi:hypothetical protein